jgi:hypothetical protein
VWGEKVHSGTGTRLHRKPGSSRQSIDKCFTADKNKSVKWEERNMSFACRKNNRQHPDRRTSVLFDTRIPVTDQNHKLPRHPFTPIILLPDNNCNNNYNSVRMPTGQNVKQEQHSAASREEKNAVRLHVPLPK